MLMPVARAEAYSSTPISEPSMPTSPSSSIGSPDPFETVSAPDPRPELAPLEWRRPVLLFLPTVVSILLTAAVMFTPRGEPFRLVYGMPLPAGLSFIFLTHASPPFYFRRRAGAH